MGAGRRWFTGMVCCGLMAVQGWAQSGMKMDGDVSGEGLERSGPPQRMEGIGNATIEISTGNAEARVWFLQGLNLLHDFWDYESERAFRESVRLDPDCAMCWWGLGESQRFRQSDSASAKVSLAKAKDLMKKATPAERLYIKATLEEAEASAKEKKAGETAKPKETKEPKFRESKATGTLRKLVTMRPEEVEAKVFLAESLINGFNKDGSPKAGTMQGQALLREVLTAHPEDSAANHYWIHAVEAGNHPEWALESARKLGSLAPASGHMVHMPGHIFYRTGDYETARASFERSMEVDETYMHDRHVNVDHDWNYVHNMMYLIADLLEEGRVERATEVSAKLNEARGTTDATLYRFSTRDGLTRLDVALPVVLRGGEWARAAAMLRASKPADSLMNLVWLRGVLLEYTTGMAALEGGDVPAASKHRDAMDEMLKAQPAGGEMAGMAHPMPAMAAPESKDVVIKPVRSFVDVAVTELRASVLMAEGKSSEADKEFAKAAEAEAGLGYREPPYYIRPVGETRGDALMRAGRYPEARGAYQQALVERPNSGYPLYGIARADAAMKDETAATAAYGRMLVAWKEADAGLPQVVAAKAWVGAHGAGAHAAGVAGGGSLR